MLSPLAGSQTPAGRGGTKRVDPDAVERLPRVQHDVENARKRTIRAGRDHDLDHRPIDRPEEEMLGILEELGDQGRLLTSSSKRGSSFDLLPPCFAAHVLVHVRTEASIRARSGRYRPFGLHLCPTRFGQSPS